MILSHSSMRYLLGIYELSRGAEKVRSSELAKLMGVSKASIVKICSQLVAQGLITKEYYGSIYLTESGIEHARDTLSKVRVLEAFFIRTFGLRENIAHEDAISCLCNLSDECSGNMIRYAMKQEG
ncbi:MAG: metal-dependent transcriptional regulator [Oscillospiraceae bacterium]|nr:metal-dependent transcriptional regulator [Oscillospiraceae bacterium]